MHRWDQGTETHIYHFSLTHLGESLREFHCFCLFTLPLSCTCTMHIFTSHFFLMAAFVILKKLVSYSVPIIRWMPDVLRMCSEWKLKDHEM